MIPPSETPSADDELNLDEILGLLWRRRWYLLGALIVTVAVALAFMHVPSPTYRAHTVLKVNGAAIQPDEMDPFTGLFIS